MRELVVKYLHNRISRRGFVGGLTKAGITMTAAQGVLASVNSALGQTAPATAPAAGAAPGTRSRRRARPTRRAPTTMTGTRPSARATSWRSPW